MKSKKSDVPKMWRTAAAAQKAIDAAFVGLIREILKPKWTTAERKALVERLMRDADPLLLADIFGSLEPSKPKTSRKSSQDYLSDAIQHSHRANLYEAAGRLQDAKKARAKAEKAKIEGGKRRLEEPR